MGSNPVHAGTYAASHFFKQKHFFSLRLGQICVSTISVQDEASEIKLPLILLMTAHVYNRCKYKRDENFLKVWVVIVLLVRVDWPL